MKAQSLGLTQTVTFRSLKFSTEEYLIFKGGDQIVTSHH